MWETIANVLFVLFLWAATIAVALYIKSWYFVRMQIASIEREDESYTVTITNPDDPNNPRIYANVVYYTAHIDHIEAKRDGDSHTVIFPLRPGDLIKVGDTEIGYLEWCQGSCDDLITPENRVVWPNDKVVCKECDLEATEQERC